MAPSGTSTGPSPWREGFRRGFRNTSPLVLGVAGVLLLPALAGIQHAFRSGAWTEVPMKYWLRGAHDDFTAVGWTVGHLKRHPPAGGESLLVFVGSSSAREAITGDRALASAVVMAGGPRVEAYHLASSNQNFAESLAIVDNLPPTPTTVLLGVNINSFIFDQERHFQQVIGREHLLESATLRTYAVRRYGKQFPPLGILPGISYYFLNYSRIRGYRVLQGDIFPHDYDQHFYDAETTLTPAEKIQVAPRWQRTSSPLFRSSFDFNAAMLGQLVTRVRARDFGLVILELPINRDIVGDSFEAETRKYRTLLRATAAALGVDYVDFNDRLPLTSDHFHDIYHLNRSGRVIWEQALAGQLAALYRSGAIGKRTR